MADGSGVRIRRLEDTRSLLGRKRHYEIEHPGPGGQVERVTTNAPASVLGPLIGSTHPADLELWTGAADRAWDGGTGPWCGPPGTEPQPDPAAGGEVDAADVRRRAERTVKREVGTSLSAALTLLGSSLQASGAEEQASAVTRLGEELRTSSAPADRAAVVRRVQELWAGGALTGVEPTRGSLYEQTVARLLVERVPDLAAAELDRLG